MFSGCAEIGLSAWSSPRTCAESSVSVNWSRLVSLARQEHVKSAVKAINAFHAKLDETREVREPLGEPSKPTLSRAAKEHFRSELLQDDLARATTMKSHGNPPIFNGVHS